MRELSWTLPTTAALVAVAVAAAAAAAVVLSLRHVDRGTLLGTLRSTSVTSGHFAVVGVPCCENVAVADDHVADVADVAVAGAAALTALRNRRADLHREETTLLNGSSDQGLRVSFRTSASFPALSFFAPLSRSKTPENFVGRPEALRSRPA